MGGLPGDTAVPTKWAIVISRRLVILPNSLWSASNSETGGDGVSRGYARPAVNSAGIEEVDRRIAETMPPELNDLCNLLAAARPGADPRRGPHQGALY